MIIIFVDHLGSVNLWVEHLNFLAVFGLRGGFEREGGRGKGEGKALQLSRQPIILRDLL
jgi:hypothetical protein